MAGMTKLRTFIATLAIAALGGACVQSAPPPRDPVAALAPFAASVPDLPTAPPGASMPASSASLSRIVFGSCQTAEKPIPILDRIVADKPQFAVFMGDNVYGDANAGDMALPELRAQYALLAGRPEFQRLRAAVPTLATWDDHDFGLNDAGGSFSGKGLAKRIFETFWDTGARTAARDGVYDSQTFGPAGQRVQIILLDTRYGRTALERLPQGDPRGRYGQSSDPNQRMLSDTQWAWFERALMEPADVRFVVSSIQVLADGHGWEAWRTMPREQARLFDTIKRVGAKGVVFVSGDRHIAGIYRQDGLIGYPAYELTTSSLNLSFRATSDERSTNQIGDMYALVNYGTALMAWNKGAVTLQVNGETGAPVREQIVQLSEIGAR
jgi:alkaline phosphatase D